MLYHEIMKRGKKMYKNKPCLSRKWKIIIIIMIIVLVMAISFVISKRIESGFAENLYYITQIISALFVIGGVVIAVWQYILSSRRENELRQEEIEEVKRIRNKEAIELTKFYKDNIINKISIITTVYRETNIMEILGKIHVDSMVDFDKAELDKLLPAADKRRIEDIRKSKEFNDRVLSHADYFGFNLEKVQDKDKEALEKYIISSFKAMSQELLNNLEYFAISFNCRIAEEKIVYQSLHQTYIRIVSHMYYEIASNNDTGEQKLYTNVIDLFNTWNNRAKEQKTIEASVKRDVSKIDNY